MPPSTRTVPIAGLFHSAAIPSAAASSDAASSPRGSAEPTPMMIAM